ncbi:MAG: hypothetical protein EOP82_18570 [Variovorax sp.]|nr:MAG: hypothetical protein EOP82_18570 [Variovorax sp.]
MNPETIELIVDEPIAGHFYWILQKHDDGKHGGSIVVESSQGPMPSYSAAMMAGIAALQRRADARNDAAATPPIVTVRVDARQAIGRGAGR